MKRIYIAVGILIITFLLCASESVFVSKTSDTFINKINKIEKDFSKNKFEIALNNSIKMGSDWEKDSSPMDTLLFHDYVDNIKINMTKLPVYIKEKDKAAFYSTCKELKKQLESLKKSEVPSIENIV